MPAPRPEQRCTARSKRTGDQCGAYKAPGFNVCKWHGARSPKAVAAKARRDKRTEVEREMATLGLPVDVEPGEALLQEVRRTAGHVHWLSLQVQELDPDGLWWGKDSHEEGMGPEGPIDKTTEKARPPVVYEMYLRERDHLAKVAALALKAGVDERRVKLAESQAMQVAGVIRRVLGGLTLSPEQMKLGQELVIRELRALEGEGS